MLTPTTRSQAFLSREVLSHVTSAHPMSKARRIQARHRATCCISQVSRHRETSRERFDNPMSQARHRVTDCIFPGPTGNPEVTETGASDLEDCYWMPKKKDSRASSFGHNVSRNPSAQALGERLPSTLKEDDDILNLLTPRVDPNSSRAVSPRQWKLVP